MYVCMHACKHKNVKMIPENVGDVDSLTIVIVVVAAAVVNAPTVQTTTVYSLTSCIHGTNNLLL